MLNRLLHPLLDQRGLVVYLIVGGLVFAEAGIMFGFVFPGETAVLLGGVIASRHHVSLWTLMAVVVVCAIVGDSVGYWVGQRYGSRLLSVRLLAKRQRGIEYTKRFLNQRGAWAVFIARFTAFLRAMVPGLAGMSEMHYGTFLPANALGGLVWGVGYSLLGFAVGGAYTRVEQYSSWASYVILGLVVAAFVFAVVRGRRRERRMLGEDQPERGSDTPPADGGTAADPPPAEDGEAGGAHQAGAPKSETVAPAEQ